MASIQVHNVALQQNPDRYTADFNFHIRFDALEDIPCVPILVLNTLKCRVFGFSPGAPL